VIFQSPFAMPSKSFPASVPVFGPLVLASVLLAGCSKKEALPGPASEPRAIPVWAVAVEWSDVAVPVFADGVLVRKVESALSFKIDGVIHSVDVRAGGAVAAGQTLATLDPMEIDAEVARARAALEKARRDLGRAERLRSQQVSTLEEVQDATTAVELAGAGLQAAEFNRRFATISAPADGVVLQRQADPVEVVKAGTPVVRFAANDSSWIVRVGLAERELAGVSVGRAARIELTGHGGVDAQVTHIVGMLDPATRTLPVELELRDPPAGLRSGFVARVQIVPQSVPPRPVVPLEAIVAGDGLSASVFLVDEGGTRARRVPVTLEGLDDGVAYLVTRLPERARLVTSGAEFLTDGARVSVSP